MRNKIGDIFEINTPKGKAYLHYIYKDPTIGDLVRVLPGLHCERPANFDKLAGSKERYMIYFPLAAANKQKIVEKVGSYLFKFEKPKYMRTEHIVKGEFLGWHIINTDTWQRQLVKSLNSEQKQLSPWGIWNDTLLVENLVADWNLEKWG
ncbi:hypothetical protein QF042_003418 [Pedobacter sp. W3I1]|uniref:hypothetical protein n=1 Tax=Pedobacter sp. W3I1 TaxID=3042291 RepID=UPI00278A8241|nr:hypothetical protein [Pedobacter sp. W3I1]MDQ0639853.1 hypothetical protein [Pedobacter sp. W3I1]